MKRICSAGSSRKTPVNWVVTVLAPAALDLSTTARARRLDTLTVEQVNGAFVYGSATARALREAGFVESPRGLTLRRTTAGDAIRAGARG